MMRPSRRGRRGRRWHDERGQVGGLEALAFGLLIFVIGTLIVANAWAVVDAKFAVESAARQAARNYVEPGHADVEAAAAAQRAGLDSLASSRRTAGAEIAVEGDY